MRLASCAMFTPADENLRALREGLLGLSVDAPVID
jgi:hypothetical protein